MIGGMDMENYSKEKTMEKAYQSYYGKDFTFHLFHEKDAINIGLASSYVYPPVNRQELKDLAEFILKYLENNQ
jgi:hypothetical protein